MKVWPHVIQGSAKAFRWASRAEGVKAIDNIGILEAAPDNATRIHRHYFPVQSLAADPRAVAAEIIGSLRGYRHPKLYVEACFNEIGRQLTPEHGRIIAGAVPLLHGVGLKCCGPSWSTGDYDAEHWQWMRDRSWLGLDAISVHCYWGNEGFTPWHALRYRQFWQQGDPPVFVTECGRDRVEGGQGGWKRDGVSLMQYAAELLIYDAQLRQDAYVLGATVFTAGPSEDWGAFDADEVGEVLTNATLGPIVGEGFRKCEALVGPWLENEIWHLQSSEGKTSLAVGARGYAVWRARTNRTLAVCDDGQVWADGGNEYADLRRLA